MSLSFKTRFILYALSPLLLIASTILLMTREAHVLSDLELVSYEDGLLSAKKNSTINYIRLVKAAISPLLNDPNNNEQRAQQQIKQLLYQLKYDANNGGYFFIYDQKGINLVHPIHKEYEGKNLYAKKDCNGQNVVQQLLSVAKKGGGFHTYCWNKPSTSIEREKTSYIVKLDRWNWILGTGFYHDDLKQDVSQIEHQVKTNILHRLYSVLALTTLLTVLLGYLINWHITRLADQRLRKLVQRFIRIQVNERRCFARELHDGVSQLLVATKHRIALSIQQVKGSEATKTDPLPHLQDAEKILSEAIQDIRYISHKLRPRLLDNMGLKMALKNLLHEYQQRTKIDYHFSYHRSLELTDELETTLYLVIQEALTNAEKHAEAHQVTLKIEQKQNDILVKIHDDGTGFSSQKMRKKTGIGLQLIGERIELLGGTVRIASSKGEGTRIIVTLPKEIQP
jgi:two-component system NarL family sensor kinase